MSTEFLRHAVCAAACMVGVAQAQTVVAPPLPIGSNLVRVEPGMSEPERKRATRAHHHKFQHNKDFTRDDSIHGHESLTASSGQPGSGAMGSAAGGANGARAGGMVQDGKGTGPGREKTDKGASSYFFGDDAKAKKK
ncbi:MAG: hypothetical protein JWP22_4334 [Ramlibacter sp.]|nr:hypothetical protein [Ramlibacter sp.]